MTDRPSRPTPSNPLRGMTGAALALAFGAVVVVALGGSPRFRLALPSIDAPASGLSAPHVIAPAPPSAADPAALRAAAPLTSELPAYLPRLEAAPLPAPEWLSGLGGASRGIAMRGRTVFVGVGARVLAFDVTDPDAPVEIGGSPLLAGVVEDIQLAGDLAWVAAGPAGILALDVASPGSMTVVGAFETPGHSLSLEVSTDVGLLADTDHLLALDLRDPTAIRELGRWKAPERAVHVTRRGETAFLTDERRGLHVLDVRDPVAIQLLDVFDGDGKSMSSLVYGATLFVHSRREIYVLDARDPAHLVDVGHVSLGDDRGSVRAGMVIAQSGLVADGRLYDLADPWFPRRISGPLDDTKGTDLVRGDAVATDGDFVVAARGTEDGGFILADISDPRAPRRRGGMRSPGDLIGEELSRLLNEAALDLGGRRVDVRDPRRPRHVGEITLWRGAIRLNATWAFGNPILDASMQRASFELITLQPSMRSVSVPTTSGDEGRPMWFAQSGALLGDTAWMAGGTHSTDRLSPSRCPVVAALDLADIERPRWAAVLDSADDLPADITRIATDSASSTVVIGHERYRCGMYDWDGPGALTIVDATDPESPTVLEHLTMPAPVRDNVTWQGTAYVAADSGGLRVVDLVGAGAPREIAHLDEGDERALQLVLGWPYLWLGYSKNLRLIDIREPARPREIARLDVPSEVVAMTLHHGVLWVATQEAGLLGYRVGVGP